MPKIHSIREKWEALQFLYTYPKKERVSKSEKCSKFHNLERMFKRKITKTSQVKTTREKHPWKLQYKIFMGGKASFSDCPDRHLSRLPVNMKAPLSDSEMLFKLNN